jgi:imidazolonepropionase-like amidohydrolase
MLIIKARCLIDGTGAIPLKDQAVLVKDGLIHAILPWEDGAWDGEFLDLGEATLLPGFIDTHMHIVLDPADPTGFFHPDQPVPEIILRAAGNAQAALRAGITTLGDCGGPNEIIFPVRDAILRGKLVGPRILASGTPIVPAGGHGADLIGRTAGNVAEIREAVHQQVEAGADFIKVMATTGGGEKPGESHYGVRELTALRKEANKAGLQVAAHAHGTQGIRDCIAAGIQRIEHCTFFNREGVIEFDPMIAQASLSLPPT